MRNKINAMLIMSMYSCAPFLIPAGFLVKLLLRSCLFFLPARVYC